MPHIIIADQDTHTRARVHRLFSAAGYSVLAFENARGLHNQLKINKPDCLLIDSELPDSSGLDVLKQLIQDKCEIPTIVLTSQANIPSAVNAIRLGAIDYIEKPFVDRVLYQKVCRAFKGKH